MAITDYGRDMVTFGYSKKAPYHSWYPYVEGYSSEFVKGIIQQYMPSSKLILDPFGGTGSTGYGAGELGIKTYYCEINPVMQFVMKVKTACLTIEDKCRKKIAQDIDEVIWELNSGVKDHSPNVELNESYSRAFGNSVFFEKKNFNEVLRLRTFIDKIESNKPLLADVLLLACLSSLIPSSLLKRAGDVRFRTKKELEAGVPDMFASVRDALVKMRTDILNPPLLLKEIPELVCENAFDIGTKPFLGLDGVITSPPYVNGTNYFRNTKVELWFIRELKKENDLRAFRTKAVTAGINDVNRSKKPEKVECIQSVIDELNSKAYDARIPKMVWSYFYEMQTIFKGIKKHMNEGGRIVIDIGDSIYSGVHIKTDELLVSCLEDVGYKQIENVKLRVRHSNDGTPLAQSLLILAA